MKLFKRSKGFTLVELLVVVAVIGILAAIAIPAYLGVQTRTKREAAVTDLQNLASAMELYYQEHNRYAPSDGTITDLQQIKDLYRAFRPGTNRFTYSVTVSNGGQDYLIEVKGDFGSYSSVKMDQDGTVTWE